MREPKPLADTFRPSSPFVAILDVALELARIDNLGSQIAEAEARLDVLLEQLRPVLERQPDQAAHYVHRRPTVDVLVIVEIDPGGDISARTEPILSLVGVDWPEPPAVGACADADDALDGLDRALASECGSADYYRSVNPRVTLVFEPPPCEDTQ